MPRARSHRLVVIAALAGLATLLTAAPALARGRTRPSPLHVTVTLRPRDPAALAAYAVAVSTPGSGDYGRYLTPHRFGIRFGASPARIARVRRALKASGLRPGPASAGGLSIPLTASATAVRRAHLSTGGLPRSARSAVQSVVGLDTADTAHPLAVRAARRPRHPLTAAPRAGTGGPQACPTAAGDAPAQGAYTDDEIASTYGFSPLYASGDEGAGTTIAVYELEPHDPADVAAFQACYGTHARITEQPVDGGAGVGAGSDEAAFDIENLIGFAPAAHLIVYQGPNSNSGLPGSGPYDVYSAIVNQDRAQVISVSWGQCEDQLGAPAAKAESELFEQAAVQGQTIVAAAGDNGAEDCDTGGAKSSTALAVDDPASQPFVTGVGGTTLAALGPPPLQQAWHGGSASGAAAAPAVGAGGGGVSGFWAMPAYQADAPAFLHVHRSAARGAVCDQHSRYCREVPDVAADADPTTGYEIYWNGADTVPEPAGWQALGGTSGAAPLWAALFALADAAPACAGSAVGYAGPALYRAAAQHYAADFHDVTAGETDYSGTHPGDWTAGAGFDLATGLGTPDAAPLVASLCGDSLRIAPLPAQSSAVRASVALSLHAAGRRDGGLRFAAGHLPPGVRLDAASGELSGRPEHPGRYEVRVGVRDGTGARAATRFAWTVGGAPHVSRARLAGGRLMLTVRAGAHVPWLRGLRIDVPAGLRAGAAARVRVGAASSATVTRQGPVVLVTPRAPVPSLTVTIPVSGRLDAATAVSIATRSGSDGTSALRATLSGARA